MSLLVLLASPTTVIASDDFTAADSATGLVGRSTPVGSLAWVDDGQDWGISSNQAYHPGFGGNVWVDAGAADVVLECDYFNGSAVTNDGVVVRYAAGVGYVSFVLSNTVTWTLRQHLGATTVLDTGGTGALNTTYHLKVVCSGGNIEAYVDGVLECQATITDAGLLAATRYGLCANGFSGHRWDNLSLAPAEPTLVVNSATHGHVADSPALTQAHTLVAQGATQAQAVDSTALVQQHDLVVAAATHAETSEAPALTQAHVLAAQGATHTHAAETPSLQVVLGAHDAAHAVTSDTPALTQAHALAVQDAAHGQSATTVALVVNLAVQGAQHGQTSESPALVQQHQLAVDGATHGQSAENVSLAAAGALGVQDAAHAQTADNLDLTQVHVLAVDDATHAQSAATATLTQQHVLVVASASQQQTSAAPVLTQAHVLAAQGAIHGQTSQEVTLTFGEPPSPASIARAVVSIPTAEAAVTPHRHRARVGTPAATARVTPHHTSARVTIPILEGAL